MPNPDLKTAVEVLSTGDPKTGMIKRYVPPPPLTSLEILKILRSINALLAIRLGLHEKLPPHFRDYRIASGRASFTVADEFEVDLSIGDESPESQLYVIDVRPLFEPAIRPLPPNVLREIEARGNQVLATKGLEGIYDFLHDYFLTTKIMILLRQAHEMADGRWTEHLKIQQHKRTLVIQYWPNLSEKSWIEIGVRRGVDDNPSRLGVRWMREGVEIKDADVPLDVGNLSAETLVKTVIAMHTRHMLTALLEKLMKIPLFTGQRVVSLTTHPTDSFESNLMIELTPSRRCKLLVEPITGWITLQKQSERSTRIELEINARPAVTQDLLLRFKLTSMQEEVEHRAKSMGWEILRTLSIRQEDLKRNFPSTSRYMLYLRRKNWNGSWFITFVQQDDGESWWATEIQERPSQWSISSCLQIPVKGETNVTYKFLENLEKMAAGFISHFVNSRLLEQQGIQHRLLPSKSLSTAYSSAIQTPDLYIRFSSLIKASWGIDVLRLSFQGLATADGLCKLVLIGRTKEPMTQLSSTDLTEDGADVAFHPQSGSYAIALTVAVGETVITQVVEKLHRIERLIRFVTVIRKFRLNCLHVSLGRIVFQYSDTPQLTAEILFTGEEDMTLALPPTSPHRRIQKLLQNHLNHLGLENVIKALFSTLPLLLAMDQIEATLPADQTSFYIIARSVDWFRLEYTHKKYVLDCRIKVRRGAVYWYIFDPAVSGGGLTGQYPTPDRNPCEAVKRVWMEEGEGWEGLKTGVAADLRAIGEVVKRCHEVVFAAPPLLPRVQPGHGTQR
jgi:mediator of RNA polymerase II transcription subunit 14